MSRQNKRIMVVMPAVNTTLNEKTYKVLSKCISPGFEVNIVNVKYGGVESITGRAYPLTLPYIIQEILRAAEEGYDAVIPNCFADPGVVETRRLVKIPIVGPGESALHIACMLGYRLGIIELGGTQIVQLHGKGSNWARQLVISHGLSNRVISMRSMQLTIREMWNLDLVLDALYKAAKRAIEQDGAEVLVLGCTGLIGYADQLCQKLDIPVIDPVVAALKMSELMISTNLVHSRLAYPSETDVGIKVEIKYPPTLER